MSMSKMINYNYLYIGIPTINGEINGIPKLYYSNSFQNDFILLLEYFHLSEATIYVINLETMSIKEII